MADLELRLSALLLIASLNLCRRFDNAPQVILEGKDLQARNCFAAVAAMAPAREKYESGAAADYDAQDRGICGI